MGLVMPFRNRADAGSRLAQRVLHLKGNDVVVLGLPRGGVPVAFEVARALGARLDVALVRKLGVPAQPELALGAIGEDSVRVLNHDVVRGTRATSDQIAAVEAAERTELERRGDVYRQGRARVPVSGRTVVVVDDGIATGATARAACEVVRSMGASHVVMAVPVAPDDAVTMLKGSADEVVCVDTPQVFHAIGQWYDDFTQTTDAEVIDLLDTAAREHEVPGRYDVEIDVGAAVSLPAFMTIPPGSSAVVIFAHGSGSGRDSPRNQYVSDVLASAGVGTLLLDLLTPAEATDHANAFDIDLLARRLTAAIDWLDSWWAERFAPQAHGSTEPAIGLFGASTGAAAALQMAADDKRRVRAVVSRGGRPDLAVDYLPNVVAPTLLIVGSRDDTVLELNREAQRHLIDAQVTVVPGAGHLFEEPGTLSAVAQLARDWFRHFLSP